MKAIDKFVLKAYLGPMFATFFIVMFILLMNALWLYVDDLVGKGLPMIAIAKMLFFYTSTMIPIGLPLATLLAAIMTMGNMGENYELLAFKSAGISLLRIMRSIIIVAVMISIASFFVINDYVPYSVQQVGKILADIQNQRQEIELTDGVFFNGIPSVSIRVDHQDPDTKKLKGVLIYDNRDYNLAKTIVADSGYIAISTDKKYLTVSLQNGQSFEDNRDYNWFLKPVLKTNQFHSQNMIIELEGFDFSETGGNMYEGRSETKNIIELQADIDSLFISAEISVNKFRNTFLYQYLYSKDTVVINKEYRDSASNTRSDILFSQKDVDTINISKKFMIYEDALSAANSLTYYTQGGHAQTSVNTINLYRSKADWHKKLSLPVSVLIFFLIGAPLGAIIRRGGLGLPMVISVLFFVFYYIMTISGEKLVKEGAWNPLLGMWLSSIVLLPIALFLTYKAKRDSQLFNIDIYINVFRKLGIITIINKISTVFKRFKLNKIKIWKKRKKSN